MVRQQVKNLTVWKSQTERILHLNIFGKSPPILIRFFFCDLWALKVPAGSHLQERNMIILPPCLLHELFRNDLLLVSVMSCSFNGSSHLLFCSLKCESAAFHTFFNLLLLK